MIRLKSHSLGGLELGRLAIGALGGDTSRKHAPRDLYKRILNSMPSALRESLVAWYSPNLQGLTNAELADSLNEYVDGLKDLSDNGNHMTLKGFSGMGPSDDDEEGSNGGGYVNEDGDLCFDGNDDCGILSQLKALDNYTLVLFFKPSARKGTFAKKNGNYLLLVNDDNAEHFYSKIKNSSWSPYVNYPTDNITIIRSDGKFCNVTKSVGTQVDSVSNLYLGQNSQDNGYARMTLMSAILFDNIVDDTQLQWVKTNMLVSQSVKTNTITLYCGEFDDDGTLIDDSYDVFTFSVQHGNSLNDADGNLLAKYHKDIDATHCTSDVWYDTDGLEYAGEAITEDTTFYCERQKISDYMLEQLDGVTLSDGSTAKSHLVCMYNPKLQGLDKKSVVEDKTLLDLSGNEIDMELSGFETDIEPINADGSIVFDGVDDYGMSPTVPHQAKTIIIVGKTTDSAVSAGFLFGKGEDDGSYQDTELGVRLGNENAGTWAMFSTSASKAYSGGVPFSNIKRVVVVTRNRLNVDGTDILTRSAEYNQLFAPIRISGHRGNIKGAVIWSAIIFDSDLTDSDLTTVKSILLRDTPYLPASHTVTLRYAGKTEPLKTLTVLHNSNVTSFETYELDDTHVSDKWYVDAGLRQEYTGGWITGDCTLWCSSKEMYKYMLEQLDALELSDGSTAKERLVCWYQPKLQGLTKESVLTDKVLADLSGNNMDVTLYNFTEEQQIIKANGDICFAEGTYGYIKLSATKVLSSFTFISKATPIKQSAHIMVRFGNNNHAISRQSNSLWNFGKENATGYVNGLLSFTQSKAYYNNNEYTIESGANKAIGEIIFNKYSTSSSNFGNSEYTSVLLFDAEMTKEQIDKIYTILKIQ